MRREPAPTLFDLPPGITDAMCRQLTVIEASMPIGCTRARNGWFGTAGRVGLRDAPLLTHQGLARVSYRGRNPRLLITAKGRREISERTAP
ncbi:hypothetical protein [Aureimonas sp. AU40]|uniref:hypothetical protein n=1 Tax=Aureimonas sp. AU40 TaxID=1637747 RepID=UPI0007840049|nr:hypothetical protein [Aureimonas sp. AU40]